MEMNKQKEREPRPKETKEEGRTEPAVDRRPSPAPQKLPKEIHSPEKKSG